MIADEIARYIRENGIKQAFLCERTGLTKHSVSAALHGRRKISVEEYAKICAALNVPYEYFFARRRESAAQAFN